MSAYRNKPVLFDQYTAAEALAANRLVIIDPSDDTKVRYPEADNDTQLVGITAFAVASGEQVDVAVIGIFPLQVDGAVANIAWGDYVAAHDTVGFGRKAATTKEAIGQARGAATEDGALIPVLIGIHVHTDAA